MSWQQLRQSLQHAAKATDPSDLGLEQETHCYVLPGRPIETGLVVLEPAQATPACVAHTTQAAEALKQPEGEVTEEDDGHATEATGVTELIGKVASMTAPAARGVPAGIPSSDPGNVSMSQARPSLAEQLQMPLSPTPNSPHHQGSQSSPMRSSSPSPQSTPSSSQQRIAPSPSLTVSPGAANSTQAVHPEGSDEQVEGSSSGASPSIPNSPAMSQGISMPDSSPRTPSNSPVQVSEARSHGQRQSSEALALSQALSLMPEHIPHESDVLGLDDIPSGTSSGLLGTSTALLGSPTALWGSGSELLGTSLSQLGTGTAHMSTGREHLGMSAEQWGHLAAQLGNYASQGTHAGHTESADNATMGADILSLLAGTHRESLIPNTDRPKADRLWPPHIGSDRQPAIPGSRAAQLSSYSEAMMLSNALQGVLQHGMDRQVPSNALRSLSQGLGHPMPGWNPFEQQVFLATLHQPLCACLPQYLCLSDCLSPPIWLSFCLCIRSPASLLGSARSLITSSGADVIPTSSCSCTISDRGAKGTPCTHMLTIP